jgi:sugar lactone lactonase YvrE
MTASMRCAALVTLMPLSGCTAPAGPLFPPPEKPVVWPKPPDRARVRYVGQLAAAGDLGARKSAGESWNEFWFGPNEPAEMVCPYGVAVSADGDRLAVADTGGRCVHLFDLARRDYRRYEAFGSPPRPLEAPVAVAWAGDALWAADAKLPAIVRYDRSHRGALVTKSELVRPSGMAISGDRCIVADAGAHAIFVFDLSGALINRFGTRGAATGELNYPSQLAVAGDGSIVVADALNFRVQRFSPEGAAWGAFGRKGDAAGDFALPKGVAIGSEGNVWVSDAHFENVQAFTPDGQLLMTFGGEGHGPGEFWLPAGLCIDSKRRLWVADSYNKRVQVFELLP